MGIAITAVSLGLVTWSSPIRFYSFDDKTTPIGYLVNALPILLTAIAATVRLLTTYSHKKPRSVTQQCPEEREPFMAQAPPHRQPHLKVTTKGDS